TCHDQSAVGQTFLFAIVGMANRNVCPNIAITRCRKEKPMNGIFESTIFWIGLVGVIVIAGFVINYVMGSLANARVHEQCRYPHRVANELPRVLHTTDRDEVLELKSETELKEN